MDEANITMCGNIDMSHALQQFYNFFNTSKFVIPSKLVMIDYIIKALDIVI